jgi:hypothetical protein
MPGLNWPAARVVLTRLTRCDLRRSAAASYGVNRNPTERPNKHIRFIGWIFFVYFMRAREA